MLKLNKTRPLPAGLSITSYKDWQPGTPIRALLDNDCHCKCYICEDKPKNAAELTVDHVVSKDHTPALALEWDNLLLACAQCNNEVKGSRFNGIINPAEENGLDPEAVIDFDMSYDRRDVRITVRSIDAAVAETKKLLDEVYADQTLTRKLAANIQEFIRLIPFADIGQEWATEYISDNISSSAAFAAFKRKIIRDDSKLCSRFAEAFV